MNCLIVRLMRQLDHFMCTVPCPGEDELAAIRGAEQVLGGMFSTSAACNRELSHSQACVAHRRRLVWHA